MKYKFVESASFIVTARNAKRSVTLGLFDGNETVGAGNVTIPPNHAVPAVGEVVEIRYFYAFRESGSIYQPVYAGKRCDIPAAECTTRHILNGVYFTPEEGGRLIATDGHRLAGAPARVPAREFVLPTAVVHVLGHPDFTLRDAAIQQPDDATNLHVQLRSGPHTLIAKTIEGHYPNYRHVIPVHLPESLTIPETHRTGLISWLGSLNGKWNSVRLTWENPGHVTLTHRDGDSVGAIIQVSVTIEGRPPAISFKPGALADAFAIGATLRLVDHLNPGMTTDPSGNFCLLMNLRAVPESVTEDAACKSPAPAIAA